MAIRDANYKGYFPTKREAKNHAAYVRREWPSLKPVRVIQSGKRWTVLTK